MPLSRFLGIHEGETGWIFGKGPSLATFDFNTAGKLRFAINDVIAHIPACKYGFANDGVAKWADVYRPGHVLFQPLRCLHEYDSTQPGAVACRVVTFHDSCEDTRLVLPPEQLLHELTIRRGTLGSAIQIIRIMGVRTIHLVGIDGGGQHAPGYEWRTRLRADHAAWVGVVWKFSGKPAGRGGTSRQETMNTIPRDYAVSASSMALNDCARRTPAS